MARIRAFLAIHPAADAVAEVAACAASLGAPCAQAGLDVSWTRPGSLHVTLKFLGDIEEDSIPLLEERLRRGLANLRLSGEPVIAVAALSAFPSPGRPRVLYAGITGADGGAPLPLIELQRAVEGWMEELGHPPEGRAYTPHVTIGRVRGGRAHGLAEILGCHQGPFGTAVRVAEIILFESRQGRSGIEYVARARVPLGTETVRSKETESP